MDLATFLTSAGTSVVLAALVTAVVGQYLNHKFSDNRDAFNAMMTKRLADAKAESDRTLEEAKAEFVAKLDRAKLDLEKSRRVHELQFETEFKIYRSLWRALSVTADAVSQIAPEYDYYSPSEKWEDVAKERIKKAGSVYDKAQRILYSNEAFIPVEIVKEAENFLKYSRSILIGIGLDLRTQKDPFRSEAIDRRVNFIKQLTDSRGVIRGMIQKQIQILYQKEGADLAISIQPNTPLLES